MKATLARDGVDAVIAIGGEDTLGVAHKLAGDGVQVVGVPKTIDNDLSATDFTFGFHTAVQIATDAIDRLHTTAESHDRVMVVEVMGRHAGWIATYSGLAGGADIILVPETPFDIDEICDRITRRHERGANFSIVVVAEGRDAGRGHDGAADRRRRRLRPRAPRRDRQPAPSRDRAAHRLRGAHDAARPPAPRRHARRAYDRVIATRFGVEAIDAVHERDFGVMVALRGTDVIRVPLEAGVAELKTVDQRLFDTAAVFFG